MKVIKTQIITCCIQLVITLVSSESLSQIPVSLKTKAEPSLINHSFVVDVDRQQTNIAIAGVFVGYNVPRSNLGLNLGGGLFYDTNKNLYLNLLQFVDSNKSVVETSTKTNQNLKNSTGNYENYIEINDTLKYFKKGKLKSWVVKDNENITTYKKRKIYKNYISNSDDFEFLNLSATNKNGKLHLGRRYAIWHNEAERVTYINQKVFGKEYRYLKLRYQDNTIYVQRKNRIVKSIELHSDYISVYKGDKNRLLNKYEIDERLAFLSEK